MIYTHSYPKDVAIVTFTVFILNIDVFVFHKLLWLKFKQPQCAIEITLKVLIAKKRKILLNRAKKNM